MKWADDYLEKHALHEPFIRVYPEQTLRQVVTIPALNESGLTRSLDSLFSAPPDHPETEVIILINSAENASTETLQANRQTFEHTRQWIATHKRPRITFHLLMEENLPARGAGAGLARKLAMDEAIHRLNLTGQPHGILLSLDADTLVEPNYLRSVPDHLSSNQSEGCAIRFTHPLDPASHPGKPYPGEVYQAITRYELHQRYYLASVQSTGYPYAFHTVGSAFAVTAHAYCAAGGMNRRQGGEDFYFIQKVASRGRFSECNTTTVHPSPRPSNRVPFGTGPAVQRQLDQPGKPYLTYHHEPFRMLHPFFQQCLAGYPNTSPESLENKQPAVLRMFLSDSNFRSAYSEILQNTASHTTFTKRFRNRFNMFWILKFLHFAEKNGYPRQPLMEACRQRFPDIMATSEKSFLESLRLQTSCR